jgi:hypothetical protein
LLGGNFVDGICFILTVRFQIHNKDKTKYKNGPHCGGSSQNVFQFNHDSAPFRVRTINLLRETVASNDAGGVKSPFNCR